MRSIFIYVPLRVLTWLVALPVWLFCIVFGLLVTLVFLAIMAVERIRLDPPLWGLALVLAFATMVKPAAGILFWLTLIVLWTRVPLKQIAASAALYVAIMLTWAACYWAWSPARVAPLDPQPNKQGFIAFVVDNPLVPFLGPPNSYVGFHLLMKFYRYREFLETGQSGARDWLVGTDGPDLLDVDGIVTKNALITFAQKYRQYTHVPQSCLAEFDHDWDRFMAWFLDPRWHSKACTGSAMGWVFHWLQLAYGEEAGSRMMLRDAVTILRVQPIAQWIVAGDLVQTLVMPNGATKPPASFAGLRVENEAYLIQAVQSGAVNQLPEAMAPYVGHVSERSAQQATISAVLAWQYETFRSLKPWLMATMLMGLVLAWRANGHGLRMFLVLATVGSASLWVVAMIMPGSDPRHEDVWSFMPLLAVATCARS